MELRGEKIVLRPMTLKGRYQFYRWATKSDAAPYWYGELYGDDVPSYVVFKHEFPDYYFDGSSIQKGRAFVIYKGDEKIGQINYNEIEERDHSVELDILIASQKYQNKGLGTDAIKTLLNYLFNKMAIRRCRIEVISKNPRAEKAFQKAGFAKIYTYIRKGIVWVVMECLSPTSKEVIKAETSTKKNNFHNL
ncbi:MAG: GNAT family N-acetyltransferase [Bacteroidia bacterium]|nr:GNAT family N-acetyltransferase [Bacteroidia bacterium]